MIEPDLFRFIELEMQKWIQNFRPAFTPKKVSYIAKTIMNEADWDNQALMHKGISWMAKRYLEVHQL